jgi:diguanylate cyclase (GGDEF)-like protein
MLTRNDTVSASRPSAAPFRLRHSVAIAGLAASIALVFALDWKTSLPLVQHLYYFPIIFAGITFGMSGGVTTAVLAVLLYHVANPHTLVWRYEEFDILQIGVFVAVGMVAARLAEDARRLHQLAMTDDLTGLHNLRSFEFEARALFQEAHANRTPISLLVTDVDRLKWINDKYGHLAGAEAVRLVGHIIAAHVPPDAVACRYGGDEFVIALPRCELAAAGRLADDLRRAVHESVPVLARVQFEKGTLSISIGLAWRSFERAEGRAAVRDRDDEIESLFRAADAALYTAKNGGRNRVHAVVTAPGSSFSHTSTNSPVTAS